MKMFNPPLPGAAPTEALKHVPVTVPEFPAQLGVTESHLRGVLESRESVTPELFRKISEAFGQGSSDIWFRVQEDHDERVSSAQHEEKPRRRNENEVS